MKASLRKWGNSLALRIPKALSEEAGLRDNTTVDLQVVDGKLVVTAQRASLESLLAKVTPRNRHAEADFGGAVGHEEP